MAMDRIDEIRTRVTLEEYAVKNVCIFVYTTYSIVTIAGTFYEIYDTRIQTENTC